MPIVDYLIITPMDEEFKAVAASWPVKLIEMAPIRRVTYYKALHRTNDREALVVITSMGSQGQATTGVFASEAIRTWSPANVVQIGIAGSQIGIAGSMVGPELPLGDVIVPGVVFGYDVGEVVELPARKSVRAPQASVPAMPIRVAQLNIYFATRPRGLAEQLSAVRALIDWMKKAIPNGSAALKRRCEKNSGAEDSRAYRPVSRRCTLVPKSFSHPETLLLNRERSHGSFVPKSDGSCVPWKWRRRDYLRQSTLRLNKHLL